MRKGHVDVLLGGGFVVMWSSGFIGAALGAGSAPATTLLAWRFIPAAALLAAWLAWRRRRIPARDLGLHAAIGLLGQIGYLYGVFAAAEHGVAAGTSALICALQPIVAVALAVPVLGETVVPRQIAGLAVGLAGVALVVGGDLGANPGVPAWAYALPVGAMFSLVGATLLERRTRPSIGVIDALAVQAAVSAAAFAALAALTGDLAPPPDPAFWTAVVILIVLAMLGGYGLYWVNLDRGGVARVSALLYLTPPATMVWAWLMFGGVLAPLSIAGVAVCAVAVPMIRPRTQNAPDPARTHPPATTRQPVA
ncbi:DMT family transporter [Actinomadura rugatobispora]|uniref:DMT family transporter n=1 Tax=Actinomadura rugatobispora TaxID=1994 RepID=A0ABW1ADF1_9ACTN|nr:DMT family transporter [Actinomadura rugatobispora]